MFLKDFYNQHLAWHYRGRMGRKDFFLSGFVVVGLAFIVLSFFSFNVPLLLLGDLFLLYVIGGLITRRIHDIGLSKIYIFIAIVGILIGRIIPYIDTLVFLCLTLVPGQKKDNIYGKNIYVESSSK